MRSRGRLGAWARAFLGAGLCLAHAPAALAETRGFLAAETTFFPSTPLDPRQEDIAPSFALDATGSYPAGPAKLTLNLSPFLRYDAYDEKRRRADLREANLVADAGDSDWLLGVGKVFWGVGETVNWVDVVNQSDLAEDFEGKAKLGQPMANHNRYTDWGRFSFFFLPVFRERPYPGTRGRLGTQPRVVAREALYESSKEEWHPDAAVRWSRNLGDLDLGLSWFRGTTREPIYQFGEVGGEPVLVPYYEIIHQVGLDAVWNPGEWLVKTEVMGRQGQGEEDFFRSLLGLEHTLYGFGGGRADLTLFTELLYDSQGNNFINPYENDVAYGLRFQFNDFRDSQLTLAGVTDWMDASTVFRAEASTRIRGSCLLTARAHSFQGIPEEDFPLNGFRRDHQIRLGLEYHF